MNHEQGHEPRPYPSKPFPFDRDYDFSYRPETYWPDLPAEETVLAKVKGTARREAARALMENPSELDEETVDFALKPTLDEDERSRWGSLDPANLGGEYLPDPEDDEVEVARIELDSSTGDVYQVLARPGPDGLIHYRVVDEYWEEGSRHRLAIDRSERPLTLGELIELIDSERQAAEGWRWNDGSDDLGLFDRDREHNFRSSESRAPTDLVEFARADSAFYPMLEDYFRDRAIAWLDDAMRRYQRASGRG